MSLLRTRKNKQLLTSWIQKLPCTFELEVPGLGILEANAGEDVSLCSIFLLPGHTPY